MHAEEIASDIAAVTMLISNVYLVGNAQSWVLVDAGTPGSEKTVRTAAEERFGADSKPNAIVLTHGHFDHSGAADSLAEHWGVRVHAHRLEFPYLTGRSAYPPLDPTAPGFFSGLSRFFRPRVPNLTSRLQEIDSKEPFPGLTGWQVFETPGHTPGHVSFFRKKDESLLAGDAVTTMDLDSFFGVVTRETKLCRPPIPATTDWAQARESVRRLADLRPGVIGAGHGLPMSDTDGEFQRLAQNFPLPEHGRYVTEPARADENGVLYLPPAPPDRVPKAAAGVVAAALLGVAGVFLTRRKVS